VVTHRLSACCRQSDTLARLGGDEFVMIVEHLGKPEGAASVAERILESFREPVLLDGRGYHVAASIGIASYPEDGSDVDTLLKHADLAMYEAKRQGRNRAIGYRCEFDMAVSQRLQLVSRLREALQNGEFRVAFQPLFDPSGRLVALEALARWQHPERGLLPPSDFIGVCEESGRQLYRRVQHH
jgi:predicted signal transduction protein with EAL and GGDEF domain